MRATTTYYVVANLSDVLLVLAAASLEAAVAVQVLSGALVPEGVIQPEGADH